MEAWRTLPHEPTPDPEAEDVCLDCGSYTAAPIHDTTRLARVVQMCGFHQRAIALLAADSLDHPGVSLADSFERYDAKCRAGDNCGQ